MCVAVLAGDRYSPTTLRRVMFWNRINPVLQKVTLGNGGTYVTDGVLLGIDPIAEVPDGILGTWYRSSPIHDLGTSSDDVDNRSECENLLLQALASHS